jgi:hypothetical protein
MLQLRENMAALGWHLDLEIWQCLARLSELCPGGLAGTPAHGK